MKLNTTKTDDLHATLQVEISQEDYQEKVDKVLADYRKRANIPGFRPGKVPAGLIKKQYGKAVLIEEINKILQDAVVDYLQKDEVDILGQPLPVEQDDIDWEQSSFSFSYELGLAPQFELKLAQRSKVPYYKVEADDKMIERYVSDYARRFGKMSEPEEFGENGILKVSFEELDSKSQKVEEGLSGSFSFGWEALSKSGKKKLKGLKKEEQTEIQVKDFDADYNLPNLMRVDSAALEKSSGKFGISIHELSAIAPAALEQELFDKVFGEGEVSSEAEFRARIKADAERVFVGDSDRKFYEDAKSFLLEKHPFDLPETFLKKWLPTASEKPLSAEEIEENFEEIKADMRWQLIENRVIKENDIKVEHEELVEYTKSMVMQQFAQYGQLPEGLDMTGIAHNVLSNKEEAQRISDQVYQQKLLQFFKEQLKLDEKAVSYDQFLKKVQD